MKKIVLLFLFCFFWGCNIPSSEDLKDERSEPKRDTLSEIRIYDTLEKNIGFVKVLDTHKPAPQDL